MAFRLGIPEKLADAPLSRRLAWLTGARLLLLCGVLGLMAVFYLRGQVTLESFSVRLAIGLLGVSFALAGVYAAVLRSGRFIHQLADAQLLLDQLTWTAVVYLSGGASSGATSFYGLSCLAGAILTGLRGAALAALSGGVCFGALLLMLQTGWLAPPPDQPLALYRLPTAEIGYYVMVNLLALVVVTLLAGYLSERLRITGGQLVRAEERAEQAERMAALGQLAAGLAHEIRNPLGSIAGSIQLLKSGKGLSEEDRRLCEIVEREAGRLNDLITDMMDLSRQRAPTFTSVDAAALVREVVELASKSGRAASDVAVIFSGPEHAWVRADDAQLRQLVWNLVRNAVQASTAGDEVEVSVRIDGQPESVELNVKDQGIGIDEEAKKRLFDAFFTTRSKGTGVGLAVVKRIADEHGFGIDVESAQGRGAEFRVHLGPPLTGG
ncbi:MAG TPA: ATP-binding protein [Polyangiaceae bacterium]|jgi:signal transduction histidine kinase